MADRDGWYMAGGLWRRRIIDEGPKGGVWQGIPLLGNAGKVRALFRSRREVVARHVCFDDSRLFKGFDTPADLARIEEMVARD
mgnify:CR=1 FL=1